METLHVYPNTIEKFISNFFEHSSQFDQETEGHEVIDSSFDDSVDESTTSSLDSSDDELSSGYETSEIKSPQVKVQRNFKTVLKVPGNTIVFHCSGDLRNNILICKFDLKFDEFLNMKSTKTRQVYLKLENLTHYTNGEYFHITKDLNVLFNHENEKDGKRTGSLILNSTNLHLNNAVMREFRMIGEIPKKAEENIQEKDDNGEIWTQTKIIRKNNRKPKKYCFIFSHKNKYHQGPKTLRIEPTTSTIIIHNSNNHSVLATRIKISGELRQLHQNKEFNGNASFQTIVRNYDINKWEYLLTSDSNKNTIDACLSMGLLDNKFIEDNLNEVPIVLNEACINTYNEEETMPESKVVDFFKKEILTCNSTTEDYENNLENGSSDPFTTKSYVESSVKSESCKQFSLALLACVKDNLVINITKPATDILSSLVEDKVTKRQARIFNRLGHEAEAWYTELRGGKEVVILGSIDTDDENTSSDEHEIIEIPWKFPPQDRGKRFKGFDEAGVDDVHELTKVITSNTLYIEIPGLTHSIF